MVVIVDYEVRICTAKTGAFLVSKNRISYKKFKRDTSKQVPSICSIVTVTVTYCLRISITITITSLHSVAEPINRN